MNNVNSGSYEICDCYRADGEAYRIQQKTMIENRYFRSYTKARNGNKKKRHSGISDHSGHSDGDMLRISYIQYYGDQMPIRGRTRLSTALPLAEEAYKVYDHYDH